MTSRIEGAHQRRGAAQSVAFDVLASAHDAAASPFFGVAKALPHVIGELVDLPRARHGFKGGHERMERVDERGVSLLVEVAHED